MIKKMKSYKITEQKFALQYMSILIHFTIMHCSKHNFDR